MCIIGATGLTHSGVAPNVFMYCLRGFTASKRRSWTGYKHKNPVSGVFALNVLGLLVIFTGGEDQSSVDWRHGCYPLGTPAIAFHVPIMEANLCVYQVKPKKK